MEHWFYVARSYIGLFAWSDFMHLKRTDSVFEESIEGRDKIKMEVALT